MSETQTQTKTATERLEALENNQGHILQTLQPMELMIKDIMDMKAALKLLNNKVDSVVKALNEQQPLTQEVINSNMIQNNVGELKTKVDAMVRSGIIVASDTVNAESFVVVSESNAEGKVTDPRLQFLLSHLQNEEIKSKLNGTKVGETVTVDDKGNSVTVLESYDVVAQQAPAQTLSPETAGSTEATLAAPETAPEAAQAAASDSSAAPAASSDSAAS